MTPPLLLTGAKFYVEGEPTTSSTSVMKPVEEAASPSELIPTSSGEGAGPPPSVESVETRTLSDPTATGKGTRSHASGLAINDLQVQATPIQASVD